jgi:hypothetical protein
MGRNPSWFRSLIKPVKSGRNLTCGRILYFHVTYSNEHILSLKYRNHVIQKHKIIYTFMITTFMKDARLDKIVFKMKTQMQSKRQD